MSELGEVEIRRPVVQTTPGQKSAGWVLRITGAFMFLVPGAYLNLVLVLVVVMEPHDDVGMNSDEFMILLLVVAGCLLLMLVGSLMGMFGALLCGRGRPQSNRRLVDWAAMLVGRDFCLVFGASGLLHGLGSFLMEGRAMAGVVILSIAVLCFVLGVFLSRWARRLCR